MIDEADNAIGLIVKQIMIWAAKKDNQIPSLSKNSSEKEIAKDKKVSEREVAIDKKPSGKDIGNDRKTSDVIAVEGLERKEEDIISVFHSNLASMLGSLDETFLRRHNSIFSENIVPQIGTENSIHDLNQKENPGNMKSPISSEKPVQMQQGSGPLAVGKTGNKSVDSKTIGTPTGTTTGTTTGTATGGALVVAPLLPESAMVTTDSFKSSATLSAALDDSTAMIRSFLVSQNLRFLSLISSKDSAIAALSRRLRIVSEELDAAAEASKSNQNNTSNHPVSAKSPSRHSEKAEKGNKHTNPKSSFTVSELLREIASLEKRLEDVSKGSITSPRRGQSATTLKEKKSTGKKKNASAAHQNSSTLGGQNLNVDLIS